MGIHHDPGGYPFVLTPLEWPAPGEPQTAISDGHRLNPGFDHGGVHDLASLDRAHLRHMRRQAMDAVDHLIALLDALDVAHEDLEPDTDAEAFTDDDLGIEDERHDGRDDDEPTLGAPERGLWHSQASWAAGSCHDGEAEAEAGYDLPEGDDERCGSDDVDREETALERAGQGFIRSGCDDSEDGHDRELDNSDIEPNLGAAEWRLDGRGGDPWQHNQGPFGVDLEDDDDAEHEEAGFANPVTGGALVAERQL